MKGTRDPRTHVLLAFFRNGRLTSVPSRASYRHAALEVLAERFDLGRTYPEAIVNELLAGDAPDPATLRRLLVDEGCLRREAGSYWRVEREAAG